MRVSVLAGSGFSLVSLWIQPEKGSFTLTCNTSLLPILYKLIHQPVSQSKACLVFGEKWLEFISQYQIKGHLNFRLLDVILYYPSHIDINLNQEILQWAKIESENSDNFKGGLYYPNNCTARHKVAILIPYR